MKNFAGDIIILHMCTKNHNHMMHDSWDTEWDRHKILSFWAIFSPFTSPLKISNIKILKKMKKMLRDVILLYIHVYYKWRSYDIWLLKYTVRQTEIFDILGRFLPFQLLYNLENRNFTLKKIPGDIIILHICTTNDNYMMYGSWDMEHVTDRIFCHFGPFFALLLS